jgi:hypothetical protein
MALGELTYYKYETSLAKFVLQAFAGMVAHGRAAAVTSPQLPLKTELGLLRIGCRHYERWWSQHERWWSRPPGWTGVGKATAKYWSEWQDLNLRPPPPERGRLSSLSTLFPMPSPLANDWPTIDVN